MCLLGKKFWFEGSLALNSRQVETALAEGLHGQIPETPSQVSRMASERSKKKPDTVPHRKKSEQSAEFGDKHSVRTGIRVHTVLVSSWKGSPVDVTADVPLLKHGRWRRKRLPADCGGSKKRIPVDGILIFSVFFAFREVAQC